MSFIYGLQPAARNCFFFRFNLLTNWRKCNMQAVTSRDFHQVKINHIVNKSPGLGVNHGDRWTLLPENFLFYRTCNTKRKGCLLSTRSKEISMISRKCTAWTDSLSRQLLMKDVPIVPAHSVLHPLNCLPTRDIRSFQTSPRCQAAPVPLLLMILKPVQKLLAIIVGR